MYEKNKDNLSPLIRSFCEFNLAKAFNKSEESCKLLKYIISTYENQLSFNSMHYLYSELYLNAREIFNYNDYEWMLESANKYLQKNSDFITKKEYDELKESLDNMKEPFNFSLLPPPLKINKDTSYKKEIFLQKEYLPVITTEINGISFY